MFDFAKGLFGGKKEKEQPQNRGDAGAGHGGATEMCGKSVERHTTEFVGKDGSKTVVNGIVPNALAGKIGFVELRVFEILDAPATDLFLDVATMQRERRDPLGAWVVGNMARTRTFSGQATGRFQLRPQKDDRLVLCLPVEGASLLRLRLFSEGGAFLAGTVVFLYNGVLMGSAPAARSFLSPDACCDGYPPEVCLPERPREFVGEARARRARASASSAVQEPPAGGGAKSGKARNNAAPAEGEAAGPPGGPEIMEVGFEDAPSAGSRSSISRRSSIHPAPRRAPEGAKGDDTLIAAAAATSSSSPSRRASYDPPVQLLIEQPARRRRAEGSTAEAKSVPSASMADFLGGGEDQERRTEIVNPHPDDQAPVGRSGGGSSRKAPTGIVRASGSTATTSWMAGDDSGLRAYHGRGPSATGRALSTGSSGPDRLGDLFEKFSLKVDNVAAAHEEYKKIWEEYAFWRQAAIHKRSRPILFRFAVGGGGGLTAVSLQLRPFGAKGTPGSDNKLSIEDLFVAMKPEHMRKGRWIVRDDAFEALVALRFPDEAARARRKSVRAEGSARVEDSWRGLASAAAIEDGEDDRGTEGGQQSGVEDDAGAVTKKQRHPLEKTASQNGPSMDIPSQATPSLSPPGTGLQILKQELGVVSNESEEDSNSDIEGAAGVSSKSEPKRPASKQSFRPPGREWDSGNRNSSRRAPPREVENEDERDVHQRTPARELAAYDRGPMRSAAISDREVRPQPRALRAEGSARAEGHARAEGSGAHHSRAPGNKDAIVTAGTTTSSSPKQGSAPPGDPASGSPASEPPPALDDTNILDTLRGRGCPQALLNLESVEFCVRRTAMTELSGVQLLTWSVNVSQFLPDLTPYAKFRLFDIAMEHEFFPIARLLLLQTRSFPDLQKLKYLIDVGGRSNMPASLEVLEDGKRVVARHFRAVARQYCLGNGGGDAYAEGLHSSSKRQPKPVDANRVLLPQFWPELEEEVARVSKRISLHPNSGRLEEGRSQELARQLKLRQIQDVLLETDSEEDGDIGEAVKSLAYRCQERLQKKADESHIATVKQARDVKQTSSRGDLGGEGGLLPSSGGAGKTRNEKTRKEGEASRISLEDGDDVDEAGSRRGSKDEGAHAGPHDRPTVLQQRAFIYDLPRIYPFRMVVSDIDHTFIMASICTNGPEMPEGSMPGMKSLYNAIAAQTHFLSIRPDMTALKSSTQRTLRAANGLYPGDYGLTLAGNAKSAVHFVAGNHTKNGERKFEVFRKLAKCYPESDLFLFGDTGEGDLRLMQEVNLLERKTLAQCRIRREKARGRKQVGAETDNALARKQCYEELSTAFLSKEKKNKKEKRKDDEKIQSAGELLKGPPSSGKRRSDAQLRGKRVEGSAAEVSAGKEDGAETESDYGDDCSLSDLERGESSAVTEPESASSSEPSASAGAVSATAVEEAFATTFAGGENSNAQTEGRVRRAPRAEGASLPQPTAKTRSAQLARMQTNRPRQGPISGYVPQRERVSELEEQQSDNFSYVDRRPARKRYHFFLRDTVEPDGVKRKTGPQERQRLFQEYDVVVINSAIDGALYCYQNLRILSKPQLRKIALDTISELVDRDWQGFRGGYDEKLNQHVRQARAAELTRAVDAVNEVLTAGELKRVMTGDGVWKAEKALGVEALEELCLRTGKDKASR